VDATCASVDAGDCDDGDDEVNPDATEVCDGIDNDCDGDSDEAEASDAQTWYADHDGDGFGDAADAQVSCSQPSGYLGDDTDCDDADAAINTDATEVCDGVDNDCDGDSDEAEASDASTWYADDDGDSYGDAGDSQQACDQPSGYVSDDSDCDDGDAGIHPAATEVCNGVDDDCDGSTDPASASDAQRWYADDDGDGYGDVGTNTVACDQPTGYVADDSDCDDLDAGAHPGAAETCDGADNDCDGTTDEADASDASSWYEDADGDSYGSSLVTTTACDQPSGYVADSSDCDDGDAAVNPAAGELCNGYDDDCDGSTDEDDAADVSTWYIDYDGDGYGSASYYVSQCYAPSGYVSDNTDCDDASATTYPGAAPYDSSSACMADADGDGYGSSTTSGSMTAGSDCDDGDASISPAASESCDGVDNDCDGSTDEASASGCSTYYYDADGDGYGTSSSQCLCASSGYYTSSLSTDCYDGSSSANPAQSTYFTTDRGDGSFDYDCNGSEDKYYTATGSCTGWPFCSGSDGWTSGVAACGSSASWQTSCSTDWFSCDSSTSTYTQACR